jgi:hypothetical protein
VPPPAAAPLAVEAPAPPVELAAKEIEADRVRARVICAKWVEARSGRVAAFVEDREGKPWQWGPPAEGHVTPGEIVADVIYAERVKAAWIEADRVYAEEVDIGR